MGGFAAPVGAEMCALPWRRVPLPGGVAGVMMVVSVIVDAGATMMP